MEDAVDAYFAVAASLEDPAMRGQAWNAGSGSSLPVAEVVRRLAEVSGRAVEPEIQGTPAEGAGIDRQYLDSAAIRSELGWAPRWELDRGLEATYRWYESALA